MEAVKKKKIQSVVARGYSRGRNEWVEQRIFRAVKLFYMIR